MIYKDRTSSDIELKAKKLIGVTYTTDDIDASILQVIPYEYPKRKIHVELETEEFTCLCPYSGLPDFARIHISYVPSRTLIELKSLKYYLYAFRNIKVYNEHATNKILEDLVKALKPNELLVRGEFSVRGGAKNTVTASYGRK